VLAGGAPQCLAPVAGCDPACGSTESCVDPGTGPECAGAPLPPESPDLPRARGVYTSITLDGNTPIVAYYDLIDGDVRVSTLNDTTSTPVILDGDGVNGRRTGDVGRFPTVAKIGNNITVVYEDFARHEVRAWQGAIGELGSGGAYSLVDLGAPDAGRSGKKFVGGGARLAQKQNAPLVVYQDASNLDLKMASLNGAQWLPTRLVDQGAHGFYSDVAVLNGTAYVVSVEARLDERGIEASRLGLIVQPVPLSWPRRPRRSGAASPDNAE
jgi:hypothetical protein